MLSIEPIRNKILELITKHESENVECVDTLLEKWEQKESDLLQRLCEKYEEKWVDIPPNSLKQTYTIGTKIGSGAFSVVRQCKKKSDGSLYALKVISKKKYAPDDLIMIHFEISLMRQTSHPNIVTLYDVFNSNKKTCLVIDLFSGGTLFDRINEKDFTEKEICKTFTQMVNALNYLHNKNIVHRDIKPENFLFVSRDKNAAVKLIDFGFARSCKKTLLNTQCGTPIYSAPEILSGTPYGTQSDMWSLGVILYIMLCGVLPFHDENDKKLYLKVQSGQYDTSSLKWHKIAHGAKDLVANLLQTDPRKRLTAKQVLGNKWLQHVNGEKNESIAKISNIRPSRVKRLSQIILIQKVTNKEINIIRDGETKKIKKKRKKRSEHE